MNKKRIAQEYLSAWDTDDRTVEAYAALARECRILASNLRFLFNVTEVADAEPYKTANDMFVAIEAHTFKVSNLFCDHPLWTPAENIAFRIVHDWYGHWGRLGDNQSGFSWAGEIAAYESQSRFHSEIARHALFTEVIGQTACFSITGEFPEQKAILLESYDG